MSAQHADLERTFSALADPTRRGILERVGREDASISELAEQFEMTLTGVTKHVRVLENAGLVGTRKEGRVRTVSAGPRRLGDAAQWIRSYQGMVEDRLGRLEVLLDRMKHADGGPD